MTTLNTLADLEARVTAGEPLSHAEAERVAACTDLVSVGFLGELARTTMHGRRVTYGRVCELAGDPWPADRGHAGEVRLVERPESVTSAFTRVQAAARLAAGVPLTAFSVADLLDLVDGDHMALADASRRLKQAGLDAVAEAPIDRLGDVETAAEVLRAVNHGGLGVWRATIGQARAADRLDLIERAAALQRETGAFKAFAPLPRIDPRELPSTGYDDVRTIAVARLVCRTTASIQVDWPLYGPKLAQVAIAYGADDIDGVAAVDAADLGPRRSAREEIERHIRMAFAEPAERDGRYEIRS
jgi:aminodeoxyfutalosine synthase